MNRSPSSAAFAALALLALPGAALDVGAGDALRPFQYGLDLIHAPDAWLVATGRGVTIAVIDSGADHAHADLAPRIRLADGATVADPIGTFRTLPVGPWNTTQDTRGHGTLVAGVAAAVRGNGVGVAGASEAWLIVVKVWDLGAPATPASIARGIHAALDRGADVLQVSLVTANAAPELRAAVDRAEAEGAVLVAAAGNDGGMVPMWPAAAPTAIGVGAVDADRAPWPFNNMASADVAAPGVDVWTTMLGNAYGAAEDGTSLAAPFVSGVVALVLDACPTLAPLQVRSLLNATAEDVGAAGFDGATGWGLVRADRAVAAARDACPA